jgi:hypothetical protein
MTGDEEAIAHMDFQSFAGNNRFATVHGTR